MRRIAWLVAILLPALAALPGTGAPPAAAEASRPNVLIIVTDDQRLEGTMGVMPKTRRWFRGGGTELTRGFVTTPLCCPSRSTTFSGRYAHNHGVLTNDQDPSRLLDMSGTMQRYLHDAGYRTAIAGKVLNHWKIEWNPPYFDRWATIRGEYFDTYWNHDGLVQKLPGYTTDLIKQDAVRFLRWFESDDARPWFLYVAVHAPHKDYLPAQGSRTRPCPRGIRCRRSTRPTGATSPRGRSGAGTSIGCGRSATRSSGRSCRWTTWSAASSGR